MKTTKEVEIKYVKLSTTLVIALVCLVIGFGAGLLTQSLIKETGSSVRSYSQPAVQSPQATSEQKQLQAINQYEKLTATDPQNAENWTQLGNLYFDSGLYGKAIEAYRKSLELAPGNPNVWTDLGIMYRRSSNPEAALKSFEEAIKADPRHEQSRYNKGVVLMHDLNDTAGAIAAWEDLLRVNPDAKAPNGQSVREMVNILKSRAAEQK